MVHSVNSNSYSGSKMNTKLSAIADMLEDLSDSEFQMEHWWLKDGIAFDDDRNQPYGVTKDVPCGCAVGHGVNKGLLGEDTIEADRERTFVNVGHQLGIPYKLAEFLFDNYSYPYYIRNKRLACVERIRFVQNEMEKNDGVQHRHLITQ